MVDGNIPSAIFGKPQGGSAYQIIEQHPAFDDPEVAGGFKRIYSGFEWRPMPADVPHPTCFGILRLGPALLIASFQDTGRDAVGRPHTLRIVCLLTSEEELATAWKQLSGQVTPPPIPDQPKLEIFGDPASYSTAP